MKKILSKYFLCFILGPLLLIVPLALTIHSLPVLAAPAANVEAKINNAASSISGSIKSGAGTASVSTGSSSTSGDKSKGTTGTATGAAGSGKSTRYINPSEMGAMPAAPSFGVDGVENPATAYDYSAEESNSGISEKEARNREREFESAAAKIDFSEENYLKKNWAEGYEFWNEKNLENNSKVNSNKGAEAYANSAFQ